MPTPVAPGIASLQAVWLSHAEPVENTFHYRKTGAWDLASLEGIANTYIVWASAHAGAFSDTCSLVKVLVADLSSASGHSAVVTPPVAVVGTRPSLSLPNNVTWALKRETGLRGRANRGRIYIIGMTEDYLQSGRQMIDGPTAATFRGFYDGLLAAQASDNGATEVILHRALGTGTDVTDYTYSDLVLDSQRRRLPGHNRHH